MSTTSHPDIVRPRLARVCLAGFQYFIAVFAVGFVLGVLRVLWLEPWLGTRVAELSEMPFMLVAIMLASRWVVQRMHLDHVKEPLWAGLIALALLLITEVVVVLELRGVSISDYIHDSDKVTGTVYLIMLWVFALFPAASDLVFPRNIDRDRK